MFKRAVASSLLSLAFSSVVAEEVCVPLIPMACPQGYAEFGYQRSLLGHHFWWFTRDDQDKLQLHEFMCVHGVCNPSAFISAMVAVSMNENPPKAARDQLAALAQFDCVANKEMCAQQKIYTDAAKVWASMELPKKIAPPVVVVPPAPPASAPIIYVVDKASSTSPDGKKPVYDFTPPATLKANGLRIAPGAVCGDLVVYKAYHTVPGGVAVCVKQ